MKIVNSHPENLVLVVNQDVRLSRNVVGSGGMSAIQFFPGDLVVPSSSHALRGSNFIGVVISVRHMSIVNRDIFHNENISYVKAHYSSVFVMWPDCVK
jgi:hypothetical protein